MKTFYLSKDGMISRHKMRGTSIAGFGFLHEDQVIIAHLSNGAREYFSYPEVKVGAHDARPLINLSNTTIEKIDIVTNTQIRMERRTSY